MKSARRFLSDAKRPFPKSYQPRHVETGRYQWWLDNNIFKPRAEEPKEQGRLTFTMLFPPPNVTGKLHIGHALTCSIQDAIVRHRTMCGDIVRWIPGIDHAGIATQTIVERTLLRDFNLRRTDMSRSEFLEQVWKWKETYGDSILEQMQRMGGAWDFDALFFTLDEPRSKAVSAAFVRLFDEGLIYRDNKMINWCTALQTAISDVEVDYEEVCNRRLKVPGTSKPILFGVLHDFAYKVADPKTGELLDREIVVSTTRIETVLGDTAVAIHPDDPRYKDLHGLIVVHPFSGRHLPIVLDPELVDMTFGTGAVKITPAHDFADFECSRRHSLSSLQIIDKQGKIINSPVEAFNGIDRFECRDRIVAALKERDLYRGVKDHTMRLAKCSRSGDILEPMMLPQWYLKCDGLARNVVDLTDAGSITIRPAYFKNQWYSWLNNIQDWCVSRQLWWGHQIPAYKVLGQSKELWVAASTEAEAYTKARRLLGATAEFKLAPDEDVLDTWFSSALLPLSALGWDGTSKVPAEYPTKVIESGADILFFWIARMALLCTHFSKQPPFSEVLLHAMVRDATGHKMSKSSGNVIDPLHVIDGISLDDLQESLRSGNLPGEILERSLKLQKAQFPDGIEESGTDALRFALIDLSQNTRQINVDMNRIYTARHFGNKIWNATGYALDHFEKNSFKFDGDAKITPTELLSKYILAKLDVCEKACNAAFDGYEFHEVTTALSRFFVSEFCDTFLELSKPVLKQGESYAARENLRVLWYCLDSFMKLAHPIMPFLTEELWSHLQRYSTSEAPKSVIQTHYPKALNFSKQFQAEERDFECILSVVRAHRSLKQSTPSSQNLPCRILSTDPRIRQLMLDNMDNLKSFTKCQELSQDESDSRFKEPVTFFISPELQVQLPKPSDSVKVAPDEQTLARLAKKLSKLEFAITKLEKEVSSERFTAQVSPDIQTKKRAQLDALKSEQHEIENKMKQS